MNKLLDERNFTVSTVVNYAYCDAVILISCSLVFHAFTDEINPKCFFVFSFLQLNLQSKYIDVKWFLTSWKKYWGLVVETILCHHRKIGQTPGWTLSSKNLCWDLKSLHREFPEVHRWLSHKFQFNICWIKNSQGCFPFQSLKSEVIFPSGAVTGDESYRDLWRRQGKLRTNLATLGSEFVFNETNPNHSTVPLLLSSRQMDHSSIKFELLLRQLVQHIQQQHSGVSICPQML